MPKVLTIENRDCKRKLIHESFFFPWRNKRFIKNVIMVLWRPWWCCDDHDMDWKQQKKENLENLERI